MTSAVFMEKTKHSEMMVYLAVWNPLKGESLIY